jgi:hypothetical protein
LPLNNSNINDSKDIFQILKTTLRNSPLDLSAGFATLRTLNVRLANLRNLVYNQSAHVDLSGAIRLSVQSKLDRRATRAARRRGDRFADVQRRFAFHVNVDFADNVDIPAELRAQKFRSARIYGLVRDTESRFGGGLVVVSDQDREQPIDFFTKLDEVLSVPMVTRYGRLDCTIVLRKNEHFVNGLVPRSVLTDATQATLNALSGDTNAVRVTGTAPFYTRAQNDNWMVNDSTAVERAVDTPTAIDTALRLCGVTLEPGDMAATVSVALCNERHTAQRQWSDQSSTQHDAGPSKVATRGANCHRATTFARTLASKRQMNRCGRFFSLCSFIVLLKPPTMVPIDQANLL